MANKSCNKRVLTNVESAAILDRQLEVVEASATFRPGILFSDGVSDDVVSLEPGTSALMEW